MCFVLFHLRLFANCLLAVDEIVLSDVCVIVYIVWLMFCCSCLWKWIFWRFFAVCGHEAFAGVCSVGCVCDDSSCDGDDGISFCCCSLLLLLDMQWVRCCWVFLSLWTILLPLLVCYSPVSSFDRYLLPFFPISLAHTTGLSAPIQEESRFDGYCIF